MFYCKVNVQYFINPFNAPDLNTILYYNCKTFVYKATNWLFIRCLFCPDIVNKYFHLMPRIWIQSCKTFNYKGTTCCLFCNANLEFQCVSSHGWIIISIPRIWIGFWIRFAKRSLMKSQLENSSVVYSVPIFIKHYDLNINIW